MLEVLILVGCWWSLCPICVALKGVVGKLVVGGQAALAVVVAAAAPAVVAVDEYFVVSFADVGDAVAADVAVVVYWIAVGGEFDGSFLSAMASLVFQLTFLTSSGQQLDCDAFAAVVVDAAVVVGVGYYVVMDVVVDVVMKEGVNWLHPSLIVYSWY